MYDELMLLWKARCAAIRDHRNNTRSNYEICTREWSAELARRGLTAEYVAPWFPGDCIVQGIMLFTWEQGISDD